jgi:dTDP-4-amino-4,6-dideoxygalactose transaminase
MSKLAINGGPKVCKKPFPDQLSFDREEIKAVNEVFKGKLLSNYRGNWQPEFWGGTAIQRLERKFEDIFEVKHALAVNSCTSALQIACGAIGLEPGDEVIVTPWSMSCSATAPMIYGAIPVFADIEHDHFCLDPKDVEAKITPRTKAIIAVDLFGQPFAKEICRIAKKHNLYIIEDAAQAIGSFYSHKQGMIQEWAGSIGHIGCFSFTQGKHLTAGEGGMITTNDEELWMECALIRNHAESVINGALDKGKIFDYNTNMVGFNMRMTEIQAAIVDKQLDKLFSFILERRYNVEEIQVALSDIPFIKNTTERKGAFHSYYVQGFYYDQSKTAALGINEGVHRDKFLAAVTAELSGEKSRPSRPLIGGGYIKPLYRMPLFQERQHWSIRKKGNYKHGICPTAEKLWKDEYFLSLLHGLPLNDKHIKLISDAFHKVAENMGELR